MNKYHVELTLSGEFEVDVFAKDQEAAEREAWDQLLDDPDLPQSLTPSKVVVEPFPRSAQLQAYKGVDPAHILDCIGWEDSDGEPQDIRVLRVSMLWIHRDNEEAEKRLASFKETAEAA